MNPLTLRRELEDLSAIEAAARLIGSDIVRVVHGVELAGRIVETEAYDQTDHASHSYRGITNRNAVMFGPAGFSYVYFTYGMHYCMNVVVGKKGFGSAVLIRALEPLEGISLMEENRGVHNPLQLLSGPAKLTQALNIDRSLNGHDLSKPPLTLRLNPSLSEEKISFSPRIGIREIRKEINLWRVTLNGSAYLSRREQ